MAKLSAPKGTFDLATPRVDLYQRVESAARKIFARHGFTEIRTPIFESTDLFARGVGEGSDLVNKEMYTFTDRGGRSLTLRPEGTAPVMRALIENGLAEKLLHQRVYYLGPMFRYERPQKGRYRQFHQIGAESIGEVPPALEAEVIAMLFSFLRELGLNDLRLTINSIGDKNCQPAYLDTLRAFIQANWEKLCPECHERFARNVLRCLDCKNENCRAIYANAPRLTGHLCEACAAHHRDFKAALAFEKVEFVENPNLVRGLDYYRRTAFEVTAEGLGSQDALLGGGRYDDLIKELGGPALPGFGFGIGLDRLVLALEHAQLARPAASALCAILFDPADAAVTAAHAIAQELRAAEIPTYLSPKPGPLGPQFKWAGKLFSDVDLLTARNQLPFALILGETEISNHSITLKQMITGEQKTVPRDQLRETIQNFLHDAAV